MVVRRHRAEHVIPHPADDTASSWSQRLNPALLSCDEKSTKGIWDSRRIEHCPTLGYLWVRFRGDVRHRPIFSLFSARFPQISRVANPGARIDAMLRNRRAACEVAMRRWVRSERRIVRRIAAFRRGLTVASLVATVSLAVVPAQGAMAATSASAW